MKIKNYTDVDTKFLREVVKFCKPSGVSKFDISFKNCQGAFRGRAYVDGTGYHDSKRTPLVIVSIGEKRRYPIRLKGGDGYLPMDIYTREEALVMLTAHELRHLWQKLHPKGWRVWGSRGQYSERDADAYSLKKLREWRRK